ncbi:YpdA family putative bacillithiol disulfide reductase [Cytobacillus purgationiresistens]|uniref:Thioredoxin reductase (NADPH) n=1 Tax=Cytobacillus purgationiresistens TaxID=863449 RepID=A0ABU0AIL9_9BACI|nr:YpdA family putative bacillithiol disulfide reductase [Cytobacillus purgationiresistens]MDQ0271106.1 thioredoxin reductase (NADPH) [Cytobacillus purgationiresistens]
MIEKDVIIIGGGPCGLAAAIAMQEIGKDSIVIEKGNVVNAIYRYPTHQTFFSSSEKLEIGDVAFVTVEQKPRRNQALTYYREVVKRKNIAVNAYEKVLSVKKAKDEKFIISTDKATYQSTYVIVATGYYDQPNYMNIPGEDLPNVFHYFKEAHPFFDKDVVVIGGKNSSVDAAIELEKAGARVTVIYRGAAYSPSVKPWILPQFESLVRHQAIKMEFEAQVKEITERSVIYEKGGERFEVKNDFVFAMTGYHPDHAFLQSMGIQKDEGTGKPKHNLETMESNVEGMYIAGVIAAGNNANEIFIENGRFHGGQIAAAIIQKEKEETI